MPSFNFSLVISRPDVDDEDAANLLYEAGCSDGIFSASGGVYQVEFDREAVSMKEAVSSAIHDVCCSNIGARILSIQMGRGPGRRWARRDRKGI